MLQKWIEIYPKPSWTMLQKAIDCLSSLNHEESFESKKRYYDL